MENRLADGPVIFLNVPKYEYNFLHLKLRRAYNLKGHNVQERAAVVGVLRMLAIG